MKPRFIKQARQFHKLICAFILAGAASASFSQSSVTVYGVLDLALRYDRASGASRTGLSSGLSRGSRLGFRAIEDLGGGFQSIAILEMGISVDDGSILGNGNSNPGFGRQSFVGLGSKDTGIVAIGRQYTPIFALSGGALDPFGANYLGTITTTQGIQSGLTSRSSNAITYSYGYATALDSPTARSGFSYAALYAPGEAADGSRSGDQAGMAFGYGIDRWFLGYGIHSTRGMQHRRHRPPRRARPLKFWVEHIALTGPHSFASLHQTENNATGPMRVERRNYSFGARVPVPTGQFIAQVQRSNDKTSANRDITNFSVGYEHVLSKRTLVYVNYGRNANGATASTPLYMSTLTVNKGDDPSAFAVGMRHSF